MAMPPARAERGLRGSLAEFKSILLSKWKQCRFGGGRMKQLKTTATILLTILTTLALAATAAEAKKAKKPAEAAATEAPAAALVAPAEPAPVAAAAPGNAPRATATCLACHGPGGKSANPLWPNLAGQKEDYIVKQIMDFKEGNRKDPLMSAIAATIANDEIRDLAKYYSSL
jgi:cytochrome c553